MGTSDSLSHGTLNPVPRRSKNNRNLMSLEKIKCIITSTTLTSEPQGRDGVLSVSSGGTVTRRETPVDLLPHPSTSVTCVVMKIANLKKKKKKKRITRDSEKESIRRVRCGNFGLILDFYGRRMVVVRGRQSP